MAQSLFNSMLLVKDSIGWNRLLLLLFPRAC